jgi:hypothetical protein
MGDPDTSPVITAAIQHYFTPKVSLLSVRGYPVTAFFVSVHVAKPLHRQGSRIEGSEGAGLKLSQSQTQHMRSARANEGLVRIVQRDVVQRDADAERHR